MRVLSKSLLYSADPPCRALDLGWLQQLYEPPELADKQLHVCFADEQVHSFWYIFKGVNGLKR